VTPRRQASASRCWTCASTQLQQIDAALSAGESLNAVAAWSGLPQASVKRHRHLGHVVAPVSVAAPAAAIHVAQQSVLPLGDQLLTDYETMKAELTSRLKTATPTVAVQILAEMRRLADSQVKVVGPRKSEKIALSDIEGYFEMETAMYDVLEKYPDVRRELSDALRALKTRRGARPLDGEVVPSASTE
jgi:hypothetical protein